MFTSLLRFVESVNIDQWLKSYPSSTEGANTTTTHTTLTHLDAQRYMKHLFQKINTSLKSRPVDFHTSKFLSKVDAHTQRNDQQKLCQSEEDCSLFEHKKVGYGDSFIKLVQQNYVSANCPKWLNGKIHKELLSRRQAPDVLIQKGF